MKKYKVFVSGISFLVSAALNERMTALSLPLLRIVHTDRHTHTLITPLNILLSPLLVQIPALSSYSNLDPEILVAFLVPTLKAY